MPPKKTTYEMENFVLNLESAAWTSRALHL